MHVEPLKRVKFRPIALLTPGHRTLTVTTVHSEKVATGRRQIETLLGELTHHCCYVTGALTQLRHTTGALSWTMKTWRGHGTQMVHESSGAQILSLRGTLDGSSNPSSDLLTALDWLRSYGVPPGSIASMAWNLWRACLPGPITVGFDPTISRRAFFGGRQEITRPGQFQHMVSADIRAAYPHSMASLPYALSLRMVSPESALDPTIPGLAHARVFVPQDMIHYPLPIRIDKERIMFGYGDGIDGIWPWCELAAAAELGAEVHVLESWAPTRTADLFIPWWDAVQDARKLPGAAGVLLKAVANALWGQFAMNGEERGIIRWEDEAGDHPVSIALEERNMPHAWTAHLAAETTARVRTRLLVEGLQESPVHVDTDGVILRRRSSLPLPSGDGPGAWRIKATIPRLEVRAPQVYRWTCGKGCGVTHAKWHYVASGVAPGLAPHLFDQAPSQGTHISYLATFDQCIPPCHIGDHQAIARCVSEAKGLSL